MTKVSRKRPLAFPESSMMYHSHVGAIIVAIFLLTCCGSLRAQSSANQNVTDQERGERGYQCPHTHWLDYSEHAEDSDYSLQGTVGEKTVRMYLHRSGTGVVGLFYFTGGDWTPILLGGEWRGDHIELTAEDKDDKPTGGHMNVRFADGRLTGDWSAGSGSRSEPVDLNVAPEPKCDGDGPWTRFDDRNSPLSFAYPASWKVVNAGDYMTLVCPNPKSMAYGLDVTISAGVGAPDVPDLLRCPEGWKYGSGCECGKKDPENLIRSCAVPETTNGNGATILNIEYGEWRTYCTDGGYVGLGEGEVRVITLGDRWIKIEASGEATSFVDRLSKSVRLGKSPRITHPATVLLTEFLVQSAGAENS